MKTFRCVRCGKEVRQTRSWQTFCSNTCRWLDWAKRHPRTEKEPEDIYPPCHYCGQPGVTIDHVPPQSLRTRLGELGLTGHYTFHEVRCCRECNCLLGARPLYTLADRKRFIKRVLRKRYARFVRMPPWSDEQLAELGHTLRTSVLSAVLTAEIVHRRLAW